MRYRFALGFTRFVAFAFTVWLAGCGVDQPAPVSAPKVEPKAKPEQKQAAAIQTPREKPAGKVWDIEGYKYDPAGRPDPFKSILVAGVPKEQMLLPPLQQREVTEMKVIGIVWGELGRSAMLQAPDGKGYTIREGTKVGPHNGTVRRITEKEVVVVEQRSNVFGEKETREVILELSPSGERTE